MASHRELLAPTDTFARRHTGDNAADTGRNARRRSATRRVDALADAAVPAHIRRGAAQPAGRPRRERRPRRAPRASPRKQAFPQLHRPRLPRHVYVPGVIQRNILENPGWYTAYTPYQAEISQGPPRSLLNFQTLVTDLTGMEIANASMLDEGTAAAEAMMMCHRPERRRSADTNTRSSSPPPATRRPSTSSAPAPSPSASRSSSGDHRTFAFTGLLRRARAISRHHRLDPRLREFFAAAHAAGAFTIVATDLLALTLLRAPGEFGADVAVGSAQRFGVPLGFGGPHAGFLATKDAFKRQMPGRLVGVSKDNGESRHAPRPRHPRATHPPRQGHVQHLHRPGPPRRHGRMYAVYHGPEGLKRIAQPRQTPHRPARRRARRLGAKVNAEPVFDTLTVLNVAADRVHAAATAQSSTCAASTPTPSGSRSTKPPRRSAQTLLAFFNESAALLASLALAPTFAYPAPSRAPPRSSQHPWRLQPLPHRARDAALHPRLETKDLSLCHSMIPSARAP
jgi:glycine dehydrogenase